MIVHGSKASPFVRKVIVYLEEKGLAYQQRDLAPVPKTPELLAMHPLGKIPIFQDGDRIIPDSSVICAYVERLHPSPALYPQDPGEYARALFLEEYSDTRLPDVVGGIFFEKFIQPTFFQQEPDHARVEALRAELPGVFDYLESQLADGAATLLPRFCVADAALGGQLGGLQFAQEPLDAQRWPKLAAYRDALFARPSFKTAMAMG